MSELGQLLKSKREKLKKTIADVANDTKITEKIIHTLEDGDFASLPSYLHAFGFLKKYSDYLGFDYENEVKEMFDTEFPKDPELVKISDASSELDEFKKKRRNIYYTFIVVALVVVLAITFGVYNIISSQVSKSSETEVVENIPVADSIPDVALAEDSDNKLVSLSDIVDVSNGRDIDNISDNDSDNVSSVAGTVEEVAQTIDNYTVVLSFDEDCWMRFVSDNDNATSSEFIASNGTVREFEFKEKFTMFIGNAGALTLTFNDVVLDNFGASGDAIWDLNYRVVDGDLEIIEDETE